MTDPYSTPKAALTHRLPEIIRPSLVQETAWLGLGAMLVLLGSIRFSEGRPEWGVAESLKSLQFPVLVFFVALYLRARSRKYLKWRIDYGLIARSYETLCAGACSVDIKNSGSGKIRRRRGLLFLTQDSLILDLQEVWHHAPMGRPEFRNLPVAAIQQMTVAKRRLVLSFPGYPEFKVKLYDPKRWLAEIERVKANPLVPAPESP